jgi:hypothetical protein
MSRWPDTSAFPARLPSRTACENSDFRRIREAAGSTASHRRAVAPQGHLAGRAGRRQSGTDPGAPLATPGGEDRPPGSGPHAQPEAVRLRPAAVVRLERTLAHWRLQVQGPCRSDHIEATMSAQLLVSAHAELGPARVADYGTVRDAPPRVKPGPKPASPAGPDRPGSYRHLRNTCRLPNEHGTRALGCGQASRAWGSGIRRSPTSVFRRPQGRHSQPDVHILWKNLLITCGGAR